MDMKMKYEIVENGCWRCTSHGTNSDGYVVIKINNKVYRGHRYAYMLKHGVIEGEVLRHTCDNRWCINPDHLIPGSHADNVRDRVLRNRSAIGVNNGRSKLSESDVLKIFHDTETPRSVLAKTYMVDSKVIRDIQSKKKWKHLTKDL